MYAIVGTVPDISFPLTSQPVRAKGDNIQIGNISITISRGTPALIAAAVKVGEVLDLELPTAFLIGDIGKGDGSGKLYAFLARELKEYQFSALCFHYLQPDVDGHYRVLEGVFSMCRRPKLIADAGFMYAAKMSGQSDEYDLFTPDIGELAFLADEDAPHPFYTRGFISREEKKAPWLIERAYRHNNAARYLLVKGEKDYVAQEGKILDVIEYPKTEALEAIGGTGDTLTGIVTALIASGMPIGKASRIAARTNRFAGYYALPSPASQISSIIPYIPKSLEESLKKER